MKTLEFSINIKAPKEKVWKILWEDKTYRKWTSVFSADSRAVTDWKEGSKVHFLNENNDGMFSIIEKNKPNEYMSIKHLGEIKDGKELPIDKFNGWYGSLENYTLKEKNGITTLTADLSTTDEFEAFLKEAFPKGFKIIKELSEEN